MRLSLTARQPFSFPAVAQSHGWAQLAPFIFDKAAGLLSYVVRLDSGSVVDLRMRQAPRGVHIETTRALSAAEQAEVQSIVTWMLMLDLDLSEFYALARQEPKLTRIEEKAQGRLLRSPTLFEDVVKTILTTNTLWSATKRMTSNIVTQFGKAQPEDASRCAFPTPTALAGTTSEVLRKETRLGYRAPYIQELAARVHSGELDLESYKTSDLPTLELRRQIMKIKGVGSYASANLLMILGRYDFLPIDSWALKMVSQEWHAGQPVGPPEVEAAFERWGKWKGLAYWLWDWSYKG